MPFFSLLDLRLRVYSIAVACGIGLSTVLAFPAHAADVAPNVMGRWRFTAALDGAEITSLDEREAAALVGQVFTISKRRIAFGSRDCGAPELAVERVEPNLYLREQAHASGAKLGLPNPVTVVDLGCTIAFVKNPDKLVIFWKGWFFDAVRLRTRHRD
jgi:hypothetical protein